MYVVYDGPREKRHSIITLFFVCCPWLSKRKKQFLKNSFYFNSTFCMLSIIEQEKKFIRLQHYFLYVVFDRGREKIHSVIKLFFVCCLWWRKKKNSFCYNVIFCMLSMMEQEKKTHSVITFFVSCLWWSNKKHSVHYNIFCVLSMMEQEKKLSLL